MEDEVETREVRLVFSLPLAPIKASVGLQVSRVLFGDGEI
jgi:hypothetical protein